MSDAEKKDEQAKPAEGAEQPKEEKKAGEGKIVILVDDDPTTLSLITGILEKEAFQVISAKTGEEAWEKWTKDITPNVIITDVLMDGMGGLGLVKQIKENEETERTPIMVVSERKNMEDTFFALGADNFMAKPIDTQAFLKLVTELANRPPPAKKSAPAEEAPKEEE